MVFRGSPHKSKTKLKNISNPSWNSGIPNSPVTATISQQLLCPCCNHSLEPCHEGQQVGSCHDSVDDPYSSDDFRMYGFKVHRCRSGRVHDWTDCPFFHPGEKARRRDPKKYSYSSELCTEFRKNGKCANHDNCGLAHGVFEVWLHPDRYRTQLCRDGEACNRKVCFFAHSVEQLRWTGDSNTADTDTTEISEATLPSVAPSDSQRMRMLSSLLRVIVADTQRMSMNEIGNRTSCGTSMFQDGGIEAPDVKWVTDLLDF